MRLSAVRGRQLRVGFRTSIVTGQILGDCVLGEHCGRFFTSIDASSSQVPNLDEETLGYKAS